MIFWMIFWIDKARNLPMLVHMARKFRIMTLLELPPFGLVCGLLWLCSCASNPFQPVADAPTPELPADASINPDAGRGNELIVKIRLEDGEELPFIVDTGSPVTIFDKTLAPKLGKCTGAAIFNNFGSHTNAGVYNMPKLYLGQTRLLTGTHTIALDLQFVMPDQAIMGILGMDCLRNYCLQLDFQAHRLRFLNSGRLDAENRGKAYPISFSNEEQGAKGLVRPYIRCGSLIGGGGHNLMIDTGYRVDGGLADDDFQKQIHQLQTLNADGVVGSQDKHRVWFPSTIWEGGKYTNLLVGAGGNILGLGFLARHLVTLDFPHRILYLEQTSVGPLVSEDMLAAASLVEHLRQRRQLPGWSEGEAGTIYLEPFPTYEVFDGRKQGDPSVYHYKVARTGADGYFKLQAAWRTDPSGKTIEEFPSP